MSWAETAYAKINLALHIRGAREDGYHELETLFAFVDNGDRLSAEIASEDALSVLGEWGAALANPFDNIVMRALSALPRADGLALTLDKRLPVAAGLGGGSADAGAVFRLIARYYGLPEDWQARAARLGADVPACVRSETCIGRGTGTDLEVIENDLAGMAVLLVNPRVPLSTADVFAAWQGEDSGPLRGAAVSDMIVHNQNDLQAVVINTLGIQPVAACLSALTSTKAKMVQMSGSGATCFGLYESMAARDEAAAYLRRAQPDWWQMAGRLR